MARPRIIIADTDVNYILSLQLKFIEEFFEKIDLEIITDRNYFENMFESPQRAEVLIVSEDLYDLSIQKHNIGNVFLMTEKNEEEQTADLNVTRIFKYTSIKEIFNEILGKSASVLNLECNVKQETQIILVYSASGGTGKTTIALGLCKVLANNYKKVLYINASRIQYFQRLLENKTPISSTDIYTKLAIANDKIYENIKHIIRNEDFSYMPPFKAPLMSLGLQYSLYKKLALSAKQTKEYDFIIIDADEAFDEDKAELINIADKVMIITKQSKTDVYATNILASYINGIKSEKYAFICNDYDKECDNTLISPSLMLQFSVSEYIEHINNLENMTCEDISREKGIQKIAYWVL